MTLEELIVGSVAGIGWGAFLFALSTLMFNFRGDDGQTTSVTAAVRIWRKDRRTIAIAFDDGPVVNVKVEHESVYQALDRYLQQRGR